MSKEIKIWKALYHYKVVSPDKQLWYGTFSSRDIAEKYMKERYPNDEYKIIEVT